MSTMHILKYANALNETPQFSSLYRSAGYPGGHAIRKVGNMHMHLDCSHSDTSDHRLIEIAQTLEKNHWPTKVSRVNFAKPGLHIDDAEYRAEYLEHTPELVAGKNTFASYLTAFLAPNVAHARDAAALCRQARAFMAENSDGFSEAEVVIEIERVAAMIDAENVRVAAPSQVEGIDLKDSLFEVHHFVDLPDHAPVAFDEWEGLCNLSGIVVGGWFQFTKPGVQALRSVKFMRNPDLMTLADETRELASIVADHVGDESGRLCVQTIVEQIADIWRL